MSNKADTHGVDTEAMKAPVTQAQINEAREALSIATTLLLSPVGTNGRVGDRAFYANFLLRMNVEFGNRIPTAGVSITDRINFYINPHFFLSLGIGQQIELIIHEIEHIVYLHPIRSKQLTDASSSKMNDHKLYNIAADANINIPLKDLTENLGVTIERLNEQLKEYGSKQRISDKDAAEVHYWKLKQFQEEMGDKLPQGFGEGEDGECDDHSTWEESDANEELAKATVKEATNKAAEATGVGNCPSHIVKQMNELNKSLVNWKRELQQFAVRTLKYNRERTRAKRNRRTGIINPGSRKQPKVKLAVCCDSSGSVSDESFTQFFAEIEKITQMGVEVTVIDADCGVAAVYEYKRGKTNVQRHGNGGTAYQPAISKAKELKVDGIIYFGDFDCSDTPNDPKIPFLWAGVGTQKPPASFGKVVYITDKR